MPQKFTTKWWTMALDNAGLRDALKWSIIAGLTATAIALVLGTTLAFASVVTPEMRRRTAT